MLKRGEGEFVVKKIRTISLSCEDGQQHKPKNKPYSYTLDNEEVK